MLKTAMTFKPKATTTNQYKARTIGAARNMDHISTHFVARQKVIEMSPNPKAYLLFVFCAIRTVCNIILRVDRGMRLGVTHLYGWLMGWLRAVREEAFFVKQRGC